MPAAAVTPAARVVTVIIGSKGSVAGRISLLGNPAAQLLGFQEILFGSRPGEDSGIHGVAVKCVDIVKNTSGEGGYLEGN